MRGRLARDRDRFCPRAIVMHPAEYARRSHVDKWGRLGRSNGCFAMDPEDFREALWHLSGGRLLYADWLSLGADGQEVAQAPAAIRPHLANGAGGIGDLGVGSY